MGERPRGKGFKGQRRPVRRPRGHSVSANLQHERPKQGRTGDQKQPERKAAHGSPRVETGGHNGGESYTDRQTCHGIQQCQHQQHISNYDQQQAHTSLAALASHTRGRSISLTAKDLSLSRVASSILKRDGAARYNGAMPPRGEKNTEPGGENRTAAAPQEGNAAGTPVTPKSFEKGIEELEAIVQELERGELSLEDSIVLFEKGMALSNACRQQLADAEIRVEILLRKGGKTIAEPFGAGTTPPNSRSSERQAPTSAASPEPGFGDESNSDDDVSIPF